MRTTLTLCLLAILSACGIKGALYLPPPPNPAATSNPPAQPIDHNKPAGAQSAPKASQ